MHNLDTHYVNFNNTTTPLSPTFNNEPISMQNTVNDLNIRFLGINYDSNFGLDTEVEDIKTSGFKFSRSVFTLSNFEQVLIESPPIVHISTHGTHHYHKINKPDEFQIALEEQQILRYLIDDHPQFSAIYAAIAIFFEMEINHFVEYGNKESKIRMPKDKKRSTLLQDTNVYGILQCILDRYGCYYEENQIIGCVEIFWGNYQWEGSDLLFTPPHSPINEYQFAALYENDVHVQQIYNEIIADYKMQELTQNMQILKHQKFNWRIMAKALQEKLEFVTVQQCDYVNEERKSDNDNSVTTCIKFKEIMDLTRELKIIPLKVNRYDLENDAERLKILIEKVSYFKDKLVTILKKAPLIPIRLDFSSSTAKNVHIIRFENKYALTEAKKEIDKIKEQIDVHHDYDIQFRNISKADDDTKKQVGFMEYMQEKLFYVDIKNKADEICVMIKKHLKSKHECKIKLVILNGCHSYILGDIFSEYVENVICIHPFVKIWASTATRFAKRFYELLKQYLLNDMTFGYAVLKAFNDAKTNIAQQCSNDFRCLSHSHSYPFCLKLHLNENWKDLQNHINDRGKFIKYRNDMNKFGVLVDEPMKNLHDDQSLMISNISITKMNELYEYLESGFDSKGEEKFVVETVYKENKYYEDLSVAFFKFKSETLRDIAMEMLEEKQYNETLILSQQILLNKDMDENKMILDNNLGWNYGIVPRCCCSPHHPHMVEDKFILLQNGQIINRSIINDISKIKVGLSKNNKEKEIKQSKLVSNNIQQTFQNDAYFGKCKQKQKKNNFDESDDI